MDDDAPDSPETDDDLIEEAQELFEACAERERNNRREFLDDLRFARLDEQWPEAIRRDREREGRPCLVINKLPAIIRQVVNDGRQNKPAITVHPVDSEADPETAEIFNGLIRHIEQSSDAEVAYDTALDFAVTAGFGYFRINTRYIADDSFEQDIVIERIANPLSVYGDPDSTAADSSDWNNAFIVDVMPTKEFKKRFPGAEKIDWKGVEWAKMKAPWRDCDDVMVAEWWRREEVEREIIALSSGEIIDLETYKAQKGLFDALEIAPVGQTRKVRSHKVTQHVMSGAEVLETVPWAGKYIPIVPVYGEEVNVEGERHLRSLVRAAKDAQKNFNYWRTTATELVALAPKTPFIGRKGAFETDAAKWATANTQSHAYIEYDGPEAPKRQPFASIPAGAIQEALNAADDIKTITGIHDASLGAPSNETSGRAIMARQREGDVSTFHFIDNLSRSIRHAGRILLDLIPKVYSTPRVIRTLGPDGSVKQAVVAPQDLQGELPPQVQQALMAQQQKAAAEAKEEAENIARIYDLTAGHYDLVVRAGPSFTSRREEAATQMIDLIRAFPQGAAVIGDLLAKNLDWPGADEIAKRFEKLLPAQLQGESPQAQAMQQQMQALAGKLQEAMQKLQQAEADRMLDVKKLMIEAYGAETDRLKAMAPKGAGISPEDLMPVVMESLRQILNSPDVLEAQAAPQAPFAAE